MMRCRCFPLPLTMIGYTCRLSAGHDGPCDFRTAEQVRADEFRAARLVPDPFVVIYGAGSAYAAEHRRHLVKLSCSRCGFSATAETEPAPVSKCDWTEASEVEGLRRKAAAINGAALQAYEAHRCEPREGTR